MALATIDHLVDIGAVKADRPLGDSEGDRALRLLEHASALVCVELGVTEADIAEWTAAEQTLVAVVTAECAAQRITYPASPTATQGMVEIGYPVRLRLTPAMRQDLARIPRGTRGSGSITLERGDQSSVSTWGNWGNDVVTSTESTWSW